MLVSGLRESKPFVQSQCVRVMVTYLQSESGEVLCKCIFEPLEQCCSDSGTAPIVGNVQLIDLEEIAAVFVAPEENDYAVADDLIVGVEDNQAAFVGFLRQFAKRQTDVGPYVTRVRVRQVEVVY